MFQAYWLKRHHDARGLLGMRAGSHFQVDIGLGNAQVGAVRLKNRITVHPEQQVGGKPVLGGLRHQ